MFNAAREDRSLTTLDTLTRTRDLLAEMIAFPTVSSESNLALIDFLAERLAAVTAAAQLRAAGEVSAQALGQANALGLQHAEWGTAVIALVALLVCAAMGRKPQLEALKPQTC